MSDAKARAAARRQALLAGGVDRLAKLTTKAKNEGDAAAAARETDGKKPVISIVTIKSFLLDPPLADLPAMPSRRDLLGNDLNFTQTGRASSLPPPNSSYHATNQELERQQQLMKALLGGNASETYLRQPSPSPGVFDRGGSPFMSFDDSMNQTSPTIRPKSLLEKLLPLFHVFSIISFLFFFVFIEETVSVDQETSNAEKWNRWADLSARPPLYGWSDSQVESFLETESVISLVVASFMELPDLANWSSLNKDIHSFGKQK